VFVERSLAGVAVGLPWAGRALGGGGRGGARVKRSHAAPGSWIHASLNLSLKNAYISPPGVLLTDTTRSCRFSRAWCSVSTTTWAGATTTCRLWPGSGTISGPPTGLDGRILDPDPRDDAKGPSGRKARPPRLRAGPIRPTIARRSR